MSSPLATLAELRSILTDGGIAVATPGTVTAPCALLGGPSGTWMSLMRVRSGVPVTWRVLLVAGSWDDATALDRLTTLADTAAMLLYAAPGWALGDVGRFGSLELAGARYLAAELTATVNATLTPLPEEV